MSIQQRSKITGIGQRTNEKLIVLDVNDVVKELDNVVTELNNLPNPLNTNPTSGTIPINNSGIFADSKLSTWGDDGNIRQLQDSSVNNMFGIFANANGFNTDPRMSNGIQWGFTNLDSGTYGTDTFFDCSIGLSPASSGYFGSGISIRTQESILLIPSGNQVDRFSVKPFSFGIGGTTVFGGNASQSSTAYFNVKGDNGFPPSYKSSYACARFDGKMTSIVLPKVSSGNQSMMAAEDGMILYNGSISKFQGYSNGVWVDLH
jgi:hypothetical protein